MCRCMVLLGSATPDIELTYRFGHQGWPVLKLPVRILAHRAAVAAQMETHGFQSSGKILAGDSMELPLPPVEVVDMRQELKAGNRSIFSRALNVALKEVVSKEQQAILFLNRLGSASYVFCRDCGYTLRCPRCDRTLTFHNQEQLLICHTCNYKRNMPSTCPKCRSAHIRQFGAGTEKVVDELEKQFPGVRAMRWDSQATRQKGSHDQILEDFSRQRADVLVGTQMLAKGLDLPMVTLVGVVLADVGLYLDDFRAAERTFQLLTQVAGRAGRSPLGGKVVLQTFQPDHYAIQAASRHDYQTFYRHEIEERRKMGYPPFSRLARLEIRHTAAVEAERLAGRMAGQVSEWIASGGFSASEIIGPVPCFFTRLAGQYRWQVILRGPDPAAILRGRDLGDWRVEIDPLSLL
jgi:primosomal protein N' (replication factor Y) (superfamily II helicase)